MFKVVKKENRIGKKSKVVIALALILILFTFAIAGWGLYKNKQSKKHKASIALQLNQQKKSDTQNDEAGLSSTKIANESVYSSTSSGLTMKLKPPTFLKSSGNHGPVPVGAVINFVCHGTVGLECYMELQDTTSSNNNLVLEKQLIQSDMGQGFASWNWTSLLGKWDVRAIIIDKEGNISASEIQKLEVVK